MLRCITEMFFERKRPAAHFARRGVKIGNKSLLHVKAEEHHVAVLDDVIFSFGTHLAFFLAGVKAAELPPPAAPLCLP